MSPRRAPGFRVRGCPPSGRSRCSFWTGGPPRAVEAAGAVLVAAPEARPARRDSKPGGDGLVRALLRRPPIRRFAKEILPERLLSRGLSASGENSGPTPP